MNFGKDINNTKLYEFPQIMIFLCGLTPMYNNAQKRKFVYPIKP